MNQDDMSATITGTGSLLNASYKYAPTASIQSVTAPPGSILVNGTATTGTGYYNTTNVGVNNAWSGVGYSPTTIQTSLKVEGDAEINGKLKFNGKDLSVILEKIEERLGILTANPELETRWEELRKVRMQYIALEKDILEKEKILEILKR